MQVSQKLPLYLFDLGNIVKMCLQPANLLFLYPWLPFALIVRGKKSSALAACRCSCFGMGPVVFSGKCYTVCQVWVNPPGYSWKSASVFLCMHTTLRLGKQRKPYCHPAGCVGRMSPCLWWCLNIQRWNTQQALSIHKNFPLSTPQCCQITLVSWWWGVCVTVSLCQTVMSMFITCL